MNKFLTLLIMLASTCAFAQSNSEDVVYLKSGSVLRGKIQPNNTNTSTQIELLGGSVFVFKQEEIDSVKKECSLKNKLRGIRNNYFRRERGFRNMTEFGIIYGVDLKKENPQPYYYYYNNNIGEDDFGLSLHTVNGYQVWPYLYLGAGVGIDRLISYKQTFSPFYLRLASEFLKKKVTPYVFCDVGYSVMWKKKSDEYYSYQNKGGLYVSCGGGLRIYTQSRASIVLSVAYKRNNSETKWWYTQYNDGTTYDIKRTYQRLVVNVGVTF
ncbi:MAG: hypothetical protein NTY88_06730 [Bacteroidetes bacterium]|nr:hypothetical protein [Bacteroidota bacterium]